jgi:hypothetical protein
MGIDLADDAQLSRLEARVVVLSGAAIALSAAT